MKNKRTKRNKVGGMEGGNEGGMKGERKKMKLR